MTSTVPAVGELSEPSLLDALLRPRSVAMIGASRDPKALGGRLLGFMARYGYQGRVYPVNGSAPEVQGLLKVLSSAWLLDQLASLPGYDPGRCGERIATLPPRH